MSEYEGEFPRDFNGYFEPFLGSGAVFFHLLPPKGFLSDLNSELINVYRSIRERPDLVERYLKRHAAKHSREYYYSLRSSKPLSQYACAARTIYLNRTCWNALYRVNLSGEFNVPIGTKSSVILPTDDFYRVSAILDNIEIGVCDFEEAIDRAGKNDFVFVDPPYTVKHNSNGFVKYNEKIFSWADQLRLKLAVDRAVSRGAKVLLTNADHESIRLLYREYPSQIFSRKSVIAGRPAARGEYQELVVRCW